MKPARKKRLKTIAIIFIIFFAIISLVLFAIGSNLNHYYSLEQVNQQIAPLHQKGIRIGGMVEKGSVKRNPENLQVEFLLTDFRNPPVLVRYNGILPDLFREGQGVIATGTLTDRYQFTAQTILAKHDEKYMPKELMQDLKNANKIGNYQHKYLEQNPQ